jgi:mannosylglucosylglycerate synthase
MREVHEGKANPGRVAVIHFFSERTDGVSLQIQENDRVLASLGWQVIECSADARGQHSFVLPALDYTTPQVLALKVGGRDEAEMGEAFERQVLAIKEGLRELLHRTRPQVIHVRNMLSLPIHPAATVAMAEFIAENPDIGFLAQHHDFSFEDDFQPGDRKQAYEIPYPEIQKRVEGALLYQAPNVHHAVINSLMQKRLLAAYGIHAAIIPDSFDFETQPLRIPSLRERLGLSEHDLVIGMMTRIIPRKAIEVAIQFIAELQQRKREVMGEKRGIHGRTIGEESRFVLLLPQAAGLDEPENAAYFQKLRHYARAAGVDLLYIGEKVVADSAYRGEADKIPFYSLYSEVDILTFPSYQEGFGNQYLEAVALGKGVVVAHEYPVMEADILPVVSPDGIISLGNNSQYVRDEAGLIHVQEEVLQAAVDREIHFLLHPEEEQSIAARVYTSLKGAYDARVVGNKLAAILQQSVPTR